LISKQQKKFNMGIRNEQKDEHGVNYLDLEASGKSNKDEYLKLFDEAQVDGKDPFLQALAFFRSMDDQQIILRWINFIYRAYQNQEFNVTLENNLKIRHQEKQAELKLDNDRRRIEQGPTNNMKQSQSNGFDHGRAGPGDNSPQYISA
jgi:hypothetical protein